MNMSVPVRNVNGFGGIQIDVVSNQIQWRNVGDTEWNPIVALSVITGPPGPAGAAGANGAVGPQGPEGPQGLQGPAGPTGAQGPQGPAGPAGADGTGISLLGEKANTGQLPASGNTTGDAWLVSGHIWIWNGTAWTDGGVIQGPAGPTGPQGPTGATGPQGPAGAAGATGATGAQGPAGPQGATGPQGPQGAAGTNGTNGRSPEMRASSTHLEYRLVGDASWIQLIALSSLGGGGPARATVTATAHSLVSGDVGKPVQGGAVYNALAAEVDPRGILDSITDANTIKLAVAGSTIDIPIALKGTTVAVGDRVDWVNATGKYEPTQEVGANPSSPKILRVNSIGGSTFNATVLVG